MERSDDIRALKLLKEHSQRLEDIRSSRKHLQQHIDEVHRRNQAGYDHDAKVTTKPEGDGNKLVTDLIDKVVDDLIDYVDKISREFDDLQGSLELFHDAVVKLLEESVAGMKKFDSAKLTR